MGIRYDSFEKQIQCRTQEIQRAMSALGRRLEGGDNSELLHWVIPNKLACAHRPLRHDPLWGGSGGTLEPKATGLVFAWTEQVRDAGIRSIISLMHDGDFRYYLSLNLDAANLVEFYKQQGFQVSHIPWEDPHHKRSSQEQRRENLLKVREKALAEYHKLPKPVMVQCSAGIDRSSPVAAFILAKTPVIQKKT